MKSDPPAELRLVSLVDVGGLDASPIVGQTPVALDVPPGSYLISLRARGFRDTRYPVCIVGNETWDGCVRLFTASELDSAYVHVPGGQMYRRTKATMSHGEQMSWRESSVLNLFATVGDLEIEVVPSFAMGMHLVTFGEYAEFLGAICYATSTGHPVERRASRF